MPSAPGNDNTGPEPKTIAEQVDSLPTDVELDEMIAKTKPTPKDAPRIVEVVRKGKTWTAHVPGVGGVQARNLIELVGMAHAMTDLREGKPALLTFEYPYAGERDTLKDSKATALLAKAAYERERDALVEKFTEDGISKADQARLLA